MSVRDIGPPRCKCCDGKSMSVTGKAHKPYRPKVFRVRGCRIYSLLVFF